MQQPFVRFSFVFIKVFRPPFLHRFTLSGTDAHHRHRRVPEQFFRHRAEQKIFDRLVRPLGPNTPENPRFPFSRLPGFPHGAPRGRYGFSPAYHPFQEFLWSGFLISFSGGPSPSPGIWPGQTALGCLGIDRFFHGIDLLLVDDVDQYHFCAWVRFAVSTAYASRVPGIGGKIDGYHHF